MLGARGIDDRIRLMSAIGDRRAVVAFAPGMKLPRTQPVIGWPLFGGDRNVHPHAAFGHVPLPSHPEQREALAHQRAVAELRRGRRIRGVRGVLEHRQNPLGAAIAGFVEQAAVAARRIDRLQEIEVRRELDEPLRVLRREMQIDDAPILRQRGIEREVDLAESFS